MAKTNIALTEAEWMVIKAVWAAEPCTAPAIQEALFAQTQWTYSTARTVMDRMVAKGLLTAEKTGKMTSYRSAVTRRQAQRGELLYALKHAFNGVLTPMVQSLLESNDLKAGELAKLEKLIREKASKGKIMKTLIVGLDAWGSRFTGFAVPMLVQSGIPIALVLAMNALSRRRVRATVRYALWVLVLVKLLLPPTLTLPTSVAYWLPGRLFHQQALPPAGVLTQIVLDGDLPRADVSAKSGPAVSAPRLPSLTWSALLFSAWLAGFCGLAAWVAWRSLCMARLLRRTIAAPDGLKELLASCRGQLGIAQAISVRLTPTPGSPVIYGLFRPVILIPAAMVDRLGASELRSILLHELAHYRRGDLWISNLQVGLQLFYWYNPLLWLANRAISRVREQAVDEMVLVEMKEGADEYPSMLVRVAQMAITRPAGSIGLLGILEPAGGLKERIEFILSRPFPCSARIGIAALPIAMIALLLVPMTSKGTDAPMDPTQDVTIFYSDIVPSGPATVGKDGAASMEPPPRKAVLNAQRARALEAKVKANPEDLSARSQLVAYYFRTMFTSKADRIARQGHILWLIEHHPDSDLRGPNYELDAGLFMDGSAYEQAKALWLQQVAANPKNPMVLGNAAAFLLLSDRSTAESLLKRNEVLEPANPRWSQALAQLYALDMNSGAGGADAGRKALAEMEKAPAISPGGDFSNLDDLAKMAFAAGDLDKAARYADDLLAEAPAHRKNWNYGNAIHHGNLILGRIALRHGKLEDAKKYLLEAGRTPGSPQLNSFGPNMALAKDLLEKGEKETVLAYFSECRVFWKRGGEKLDQWTGEVTAGDIPSFGGNLAY